MNFAVIYNKNPFSLTVLGTPGVLLGFISNLHNCALL